jgi:serine/threonine-protein kinase RsbW
MSMSNHAVGKPGPEAGFRLEGDLDFRTAGATRMALLEAVERAAGALVVDLAGVGFIDSSGLAALTEAARRAGQRGARLCLRGLDVHHHRLLHLIGLAERFDLEPPVQRNGSHAPGGGSVLPGEVCRFPGEPASVPLIRKHVGAVAREMGFTETGVRDILIAVSEAATNALNHGSPRGAEDLITVCCRADADRLVVEVTDCGQGFDPLAVPVPVAEQMREGGMGVFFMRILMDEVSFDCGSGGTTVRLVKCRV